MNYYTCGFYFKTLEEAQEKAKERSIQNRTEIPLFLLIGKVTTVVEFIYDPDLPTLFREKE
jgi:hypothetical protein